MRLNLQTKLLIPVLGILIAAPAVMVVSVNRYIMEEGKKDANRALFTAEDAFHQLLESRSRDLLLRFQNVVDEASYKSIATLVTPDMSAAAETTISRFLAGRLAEYDDDTAVMLIVSGGSQKPIGAQRGTTVELGEFARAAGSISAEALRGESATGLVSLQGAAFDVVSVPILLPEGKQVGALTVGVRLADATLQGLKKVTHTEILLVASGQVVVSTVGGIDPARQREIVASAAGNRASADNEPVPVIDPSTGEHFLALSGSTRGQPGASQGLDCVLLFSLEASRRALADTQRVLLEVSVASILLSGAIVWLSVRRIIRPLIELRDGAEAVGRGDFSRRITRAPNDECGDLAEAFNRMTANLQTSLSELEKTVETLKATQAQLVQSGKLSAVGQFVAGVAHELNNPLTAVIGFAELLSQTGTDETVRPHLEVIAKSAHRCHKIVHNLLSFARQHEPERKLTQVNATMVEVLDIMTYDLRTSNIKIVKEFQPDLPPILGDAHQLQQVFINIVANARQAIGGVQTAGKITVRTHVVDRRVRIEIADNGPGISPENMAKIFDPFFTTKPQGQGTGLGLSLVYGMIQEHGGTITARSDFGHGATFIIDLPIAASAPAAHGAPGQADGRVVRAARPRGTSVLVVDDEEWILSLSRELLTWDGHGVEIALGAEQGLEALKRKRFDLVVSDWKMPGMNGIQLYERICADYPALANRVIFMTGDVINESFRAFLRDNAKTCLSKPFPIGEFQDAVSSILGDTSRAPFPARN
jgi:two-component system, NtrC family, sensor kinase